MLKPKSKAKYIVLAFKDPRSQILYIEYEFFEYFISFKQPIASSKESKDGLWTMDFDGHCASIGSGARVVIIHP